MSDHPYSSLSPERVLDAIENLGYQCDGRLNALNSYENRVFQIGIVDSAPIIAKFYRPSRWSFDQITDEHNFCNELAAAEWPIVAPLQTNGVSAHQDGEFTFALFPRIGGHAPELDNLETIELLGRSLGRLHAIGSIKAFNHRPQLDIQSYGIESREFLLSNEFIPQSLRQAYESLSIDIIKIIDQRFSECEFKSIRIHADCHPGNILWRDDRGIFVDFDDCRMGPAVQDLWMLLSGDRQDQTNQLDSLLEGYEMFHDFDDSELVLIEPLRTLRMMNYAAWIAKRWADPAFPSAFPWFNTERYWAEHILELREQFANLHEPPLARPTGNY
ncbi:serine/threonine protein kinase [Cellvibrio sp. UBA7661]|uniref:serine/threonine protein kinase n=1 Tax=Cellvibrio sp. UBA7661 TaxID=1946311 RepID=UPI002F350E85